MITNIIVTVFEIGKYPGFWLNHTHITFRILYEITFSIPLLYFVGYAKNARSLKRLLVLIFLSQYILTVFLLRLNQNLVQLTNHQEILYLRFHLHSQSINQTLSILSVFLPFLLLLYPHITVTFVTMISEILILLISHLCSSTASLIKEIGHTQHYVHYLKRWHNFLLLSVLIILITIITKSSFSPPIIFCLQLLAVLIIFGVVLNRSTSRFQLPIFLIGISIFGILPLHFFIHKFSLLIGYLIIICICVLTWLSYVFLYLSGYEKPHQTKIN